MYPRPASHSKALGPGVTGPELSYATSHVIDRPPEPQSQIPLCGAKPFAVDPAVLAHDGNRQHTQMPYVTGSSVMAIKYKDGVLVACDTLGAYGSTKRYKSFQRVVKVNDRCVVAASGELSDFQYIQTMLDELVTDDLRSDDGIVMGPSEIYAYLTRVMYNRRNKFNPLWNSLVVGGVQGDDSAPFLGLVAMIGTCYTDSHVTTGFANHLARPIMRDRQRDDMSEEEAMAVLHDCLKVCYYRDKSGINKFQVAKVTKDGVDVSEPFSLDVKWDYAMFAKPTEWAVGAW